MSRVRRPAPTAPPAQPHRDLTAGDLGRAGFYQSLAGAAGGTAAGFAADHFGADGMGQLISSVIGGAMARHVVAKRQARRFQASHPEHNLTAHDLGRAGFHQTAASFVGGIGGALAADHLGAGDLGGLGASIAAGGIASHLMARRQAAQFNAMRAARHQTLASVVKNAQFEARHRRVHGKFA